jgi:23S rRNA (uracil1939-C5)-methyltransferase
VEQTRRFVRERRWTGYSTRDDSGLLRHLVVREGQNTGDLLVALVTRESEPGLDDLGPYLAERIPGLTGVVLLVNRTRATIARGALERVLWGRPHFEERLNGLTFELHALSFFQTNTRGAEALVHALDAMIDPAEPGRLLDLYCGAGTLGLALARRFREVLGVEQVPEAVADAVRNAQRNGIAHARFEAADVEEWMRSARPGSCDVVVVDPPRAGLHPRALAALPRLGARSVLYVSCNPSTLARDAASLVAAGYRATGLRVLDLFPQTAHVESILRLER